MDDIKLALLGNKEAAKRLTDAGMLLECKRCEHDLDSMEEAQNFCPACGAPMTDEAVDMVLKRLEVPKDDQT